MEIFLFENKMATTTIRKPDGSASKDDLAETSQALFCACTSQYQDAIELVMILLEYKDLLNIDINEKAGTSQVTALYIVQARKIGIYVIC